MKLTKKKKGFTIVELVIVIGVIGILSGILIPTFVNVNQKAEVAALKSNLANAYSAYAADAADGEVDKDLVKDVTGAAWDSTKTYTLEFAKQADVVLVSGGKQYAFNTEKNEWNTEGATVDVTTAKNAVLKIGTAWNDATYGGFKVYDKSVDHTAA